MQCWTWLYLGLSLVQAALLGTAFRAQRAGKQCVSRVNPIRPNDVSSNVAVIQSENRTCSSMRQQVWGRGAVLSRKAEICPLLVHKAGERRCWLTYACCGRAGCVRLPDELHPGLDGGGRSNSDDRRLLGQLQLLWLQFADGQGVVGAQPGNRKAPPLQALLHCSQARSADQVCVFAQLAWCVPVEQDVITGLSGRSGRVRRCSRRCVRGSCGHASHTPAMCG